MSASENQGKTGGAALASYTYVGQHWNAAAFVRVQQSNADDSPRNYALAVAGGIAWAGGMLAAGRPGQPGLDRRRLGADRLRVPGIRPRRVAGVSAGAVVNFHARELRAYVGILRLVSGERSRPAEYFDATLDVAGKPFTFVTGRGGEFYIEDVPPGRYRGQLRSNGTRCSFELDVRAAQGPLTELGDIACVQEEGATERADLR